MYFGENRDKVESFKEMLRSQAIARRLMEIRKFEDWQRLAARQEPDPTGRASDVLTLTVEDAKFLIQCGVAIE